MSETSASRHILITGGAGFIGSNFIRHISTHRPHWKIINLDKLTYAGNAAQLEGLAKLPNYQFIQGDIGDHTLLEGIFTKFTIDAVVHFAAESHVDNSIAAPADFIQTNIVGTFSLLETCRTHWQDGPGTKCHGRFLHISTDEVFGALGKEGKFRENSPYRPNSPYSASKAGSDHLVRSYYHTYGMDAVITNCSNNYGPFQHDEKLIPTIIRKAISGAPIPLYGDGSNIRDWLYVEDHCQALLLCLEEGKAGEQYLIGGENEWTNLDLVRYICERLDTMAPRNDGSSYFNQVQFVTDRPGHDHRYAVDATKIRNQLGWVPKTRFAAGMDLTIQWYLKQYKND